MGKKSSEHDPLQIAAGRNASDDALDESNRFFSTLARISPVGIFRTDAQGNCVYVNERWCKITGIKYNEALGAGWAQAIHTDDREKVAQAWYISAQARRHFIMEYRVQRPNGVTRWVQGEAVAEMDAADEVVGYVGTITDITQSKQAEDELQRFFKIIPDLVCIASTDGRFLKINPMWQEVLGYTEQEILAKPFLEFIHPDDRDATMKEVERQLAGEPTIQFTNRYRCKDGSYRWLEWRATPAVDKKLLFAAARDITERKKIEVAQHEALDRFQKITQLVPGIVYQFRLRHDGSACVPYASEAAREIYRFDPEEVREDASRIFTSVHPDDLESFMASIQTSARDLTPWQHEYRLKFGDGTVRWLFGNSIPQREADGSTLWHGFITDITGRKESEERLRQSDRKLRAFLDNISDTIWLIDANLSMAYVSPSVTRLLGVLPEELIGRPSALVIHPDDMGIITTAQRYVMEHHGEPHTIQYRVSHKDGRWIYVESTGVNMLDNPAINGVLVTMRDITERKQAEAQIRNLAFYDSLTQLPNRRLLNDRLGQIMAASKRSSRYGVLMFLDLDNFKPLNDMHGHSVGDLLLVEVAHRLISCVREVDTVARFGGDEFVVMLSELDEDKAESTAQTSIVAEKIRTALAEPYLLKFKQENNAEKIVEHHCTSSIGIVLFINHETSAEDILKWADTAMYQAKSDGRNLVRFHK